MLILALSISEGQPGRAGPEWPSLDQTASEAGCGDPNWGWGVGIYHFFLSFLCSRLELYFGDACITHSSTFLDQIFSEV